MSFRDRIADNMRQIAAQSPAQLAINLIIVIGVLALLAAIGFIPWAGMIGGAIGYVAVQVIARVWFSPN
jgi:hypothetical protein